MYSIINYAWIKRHTTEANFVDIPTSIDVLSIRVHHWQRPNRGEEEMGWGPLWVPWAVPTLVRKDRRRTHLGRLHHWSRLWSWSQLSCSCWCRGRKCCSRGATWCRASVRWGLACRLGSSGVQLGGLASSLALAPSSPRLRLRRTR